MFAAATVMALIGAGASLLRGKRYVHGGCGEPRPRSTWTPSVAGIGDGRRVTGRHTKTIRSVSCTTGAGQIPWGTSMTGTQLATTVWRVAADHGSLAVRGR